MPGYGDGGMSNGPRALAKAKAQPLGDTGVAAVATTHGKAVARSVCASKGHGGRGQRARLGAAMAKAMKGSSAAGLP